MVPVNIQMVVEPTYHGVHASLRGLLKDIVCLVQAHAITPKEITRALKQLQRQLKAEEAYQPTNMGPCQGLPTPFELISWLLDQQQILSAATGSVKQRCMRNHKQSAPAPPLLLPPPALSQQKQKQLQQLQQQQRSAPPQTAAAALLAPPMAKASNPGGHANAAERSQVNCSSRPCSKETAASTCIFLQPADQSPQPSIVAGPPAAQTTRRLKRKIQTKQRCINSSNRKILACKLKERSLDCCLAVAALDKSSKLAMRDTSHPAAAQVLQLLDVDGREPVQNAATEVQAAAGTAGSSAGQVSLQQQQQHQSRRLPAFVAHARLKRTLLWSAAAPAAADDAAATSNPNPSDSAATANDPLQKLITLKKLALASFQADLRHRITSEAPGKQYCHISLPGAPAGTVCSNLAGNSSICAGAGSNLDETHSDWQQGQPRMLALFTSAVKARQQGAMRSSGHSSLQKARNKAMMDQHKHEAAEHQRRREEAAAARLSALKNASLPEYLDMLKQAKNGRLQQVLEQTDDCLRQLAAKLGVSNLLDAVEAAGDIGTEDVATQEGAGIIGSSSAWSKLASQLHADIKQQPAMLKGGQLREYQMQGVRWLVGLSEKGLNGILADDMGLGKTVQVIAMVCHCVEVQQSPGPFLIVCPASVISNWAAELSRWAPDLSVVQYKGSAEAREEVYVKQVRKKSFNVLLTTYELLMAPADRARLSRIKWRCIVVDEGHRLKNADCKLAQELRAYNSKSRLLLTGTPLQNKLSELWSLLNFLMPDVFNSADDFDSWFGAPLQAIKEAQAGGAADTAGSAAEASMLSQEEYLLVTHRLHQVLRPFMMRRLKESVATELPGKTEVVLKCQLSPYQAALYDLVKTKLRNLAAAGTAGSSNGTAAAAAGVKGINNTVMELRNICNHPVLSKLHPEYGEDLLKDQISSLAGPAGARLPAVLRLSCKVDLLDQVLTRLKAGGHKVLLFCTMTRLLDVLEEYLDWRGFSYLRLDGGTGGQERAEAVNKFNDPNSGVFLFMLSLRAGGVGLNLQAADTVIMYDSDWNPQIDLQAQARAHRIGQAKKVLVVRLVAEHTIEEHILQVAEQKRKFADSSITGGFFDGSTSAEARRQYLLQIIDTNPAAAAAGAAAGMTASTLNKLIARNDEELQLWQDTDNKKLLALQQQQGAGSSTVLAAAGEDLAAVEQPICRLATEAESSELIAAAREAAAPKPEEDLSSYGRGMRGARSADTAEQAAAAAASKRQRRAAAVATSSQKTAAAAKEKRPPGRPGKNLAPSGGGAAAAGSAAKVIAAALAATKAASAVCSTAKTDVDAADSEAAAAAAALESTAESPPAVAAAAAAGKRQSAVQAADRAAAAAVAKAFGRSTTTAAAAADPKSHTRAAAMLEPVVHSPAACSTVHPRAAAAPQAQQPTPAEAVKPAAAIVTAAATADQAAATTKAAAAARNGGQVMNADAAAPANDTAAIPPADNTAAQPAAAAVVGKGLHPAVAEAAATVTEPTGAATVVPAPAVPTAAGLNVANQPMMVKRRPGRPSKADSAARAAAAATAEAERDTSTIITKRIRASMAAADVIDAYPKPAAAAAMADDEPLLKKQKAQTAAAAAAAAGSSAGGRGSSRMSETVEVCCGTVQGWYSIVREEVLLKHDSQQQQQQGRQLRASSSSKPQQQQQQQGELWMSKSAFMKLGGQSHKHDANKAIKLLLPDGQRGVSIGCYIKQYERWERKQQKERENRGSGGPAAAAAGGRSGSSRRSSSPEVEGIVGTTTAAAAAAATGSAAAGEIISCDNARSATAADPTRALAAIAAVNAVEVDKAAAGGEVPLLKKRGRPSKAETAAKLAAEAEALLGGSSGLPKESSTSLKQQLLGGRGVKRAAVGAAAAGSRADAAAGVVSSKRQKLDATAAVPGLVADAAAAFDVMCSIQKHVQQQRVALHKQQQQFAAATASDRDTVKALVILEQVFDNMWQ